jgi:hypothetical protein
VVQPHPQRAFVDGVEALNAVTLPPTSARLLVAPAAFWREYPRFGADWMRPTWRAEGSASRSTGTPAR